MEEKKRNQCFIFLMVVGTVLLFFPLLTLGIMHNDELLARYWSMLRGKGIFDSFIYRTSSGKRTGYVLPGSACDTDSGVYRKIKILLSNLAGSYSYIQYWIICKTDRRDFS